MADEAAKQQKIGNFIVLDRIGKGGMGAVYKAEDPTLHRIVALKLLPAHLAEDAEFVKRFQLEAMAAARLSHSHLVQVYAAGEDAGSHYIAMEFVDGESLKQRMQRYPHMPPAEALAIAVYVAEALRYAWNKAKIIHRDIKPDNILLSKDGEVKVADLGLAKSLQQKSVTLTTTGMVMGSPFYISPEQAQGKKDLDFHTDIYSLGCTLFHMLGGRPPFESEEMTALFYQHVHEPPPDLAKLCPDCPPKVVQLVKRMMSKDPKQRTPTYDALITEMQGIYHELKRAKELRAVTAKAQERRTLWLIYGGAAAAVLAVIGGIVFFGTSSDKARQAPKENAIPPAATATTETLEPGAIRLWDAPDKIPSDATCVRWENNALVLGDGTNYGGLNAFSPKSCDVIMRAEVRMISSSVLQLLIRCKGGGNYYRFSINHVIVELHSLHLNKDTTLCSWPLPRTYRSDEWVRLELRAIGDKLTASLDGQTLGTIHDTSRPESGGVEIYGYGYVRNIVYVPLDKPGHAAASVTATTTASPSQGKVIDLLALVDVEKDSLAGKWERKADHVELGPTKDPSDFNGLLRLPYVPPEEYNVTLRFQGSGKGGASSAPGPMIVLPTTGAGILWLANTDDREKDRGTWSHFEMLDGKNAWDHKLGDRPGAPTAQIPPREMHSTTVEVRKNGLLRGLIDGKEVVRWQGDLRRFRLHAAVNSYVQGVKELVVGRLSRGMDIYGIEVREVTGKGTFTRGAPTTQPPAHVASP